MKKLITIFAFVLFISVSVFAQSQAVNITSGKISHSGRVFTAGVAELVSPVFNSVGTIVNTPSSPWVNVCRDLECRPGSTFNSGGTGLQVDDIHRIGDFTIDGKTFSGAYYSGLISISQHTFLIPRITKKKGLLFFTARFEMSGSLRVCQINDFASGCPSDKILFNGNIFGQGTLRITMRVKFEANGTLQHYIQPENFEYIFEP